MIANQSSRQTANSIDLSRYVRVYDQAWTPEFCAQLINVFERNTHLQLPNGSNTLEGLAESDWVEMNIGRYSDPPTQRFYMDSILKAKARYEKDCGIEPPLPDAPTYSEMRLKRYRPGGKEKFQPHYDSVGPTANRFLVLLWYLNDVAVGGETSFMELGIDVKPKTGRLLMFPPYWMYRHAGCAPVSGNKYIMSTYAQW